MLIADEDMTISLVNKTFENILKQNKADIEGKQNWINMLVPADRDKIENFHKTHKREIHWPLFLKHMKHRPISMEILKISLLHSISYPEQEKA